MSEPVLRCEGVVVGYGGQALLPPVDAAFGAGQLWAIIGRNGSGKTTLLRTVLGLHPPLRGRVHRGADMRLAYVPQRTSFDDLYPLDVAQVVAMGLERRWSFLRPRIGVPSEVREALEAVGAADLSGQLYRRLSEGQKQRVLLARVIASGAHLAVLDEPTAAMDSVAEREALQLLDSVRRRYGTTIVVVSHFLGIAREIADHAMLLDRDTQTVVVGTPRDVLTHPVFQERYSGEIA